MKIEIYFFKCKTSIFLGLILKQLFPLGITVDMNLSYGGVR